MCLALSATGAHSRHPYWLLSSAPLLIVTVLTINPIGSLISLCQPKQPLKDGPLAWVNPRNFLRRLTVGPPTSLRRNPPILRAATIRNPRRTINRQLATHLVTIRPLVTPRQLPLPRLTPRPTRLALAPRIRLAAVPILPRRRRDTPLRNTRVAATAEAAQIPSLAVPIPLARLATTIPIRLKLHPIPTLGVHHSNNHSINSISNQRNNSPRNSKPTLLPIVAM